MQIETKEIDLNIKGKDGNTKAFFIQKHRPQVPMCFIRTVTGHMLFCQEDHPVWIKNSDGIDTVVDAKNIVVGNDKIWVDNTTINIPVCQDLNKNRGDDYENFYQALIEIFDNNMVTPIHNPDYFIGDDPTNFYLNLDKLNMNNSDYLTVLLSFMCTHTKDAPFIIHSFNLVSQLKMIADHLKCECIINLVLGKGSNTGWYVQSINLKKEVEFQSQYQEYVDIDTVISGIENYQGYVYDLKTESEEFMNNNVQTHNSFHTGGAVVFRKIDIIKEIGSGISQEDENILSKMLKQTDNDLYCNTDSVTIVVDKTIFKDDYKIEKTPLTYNLPLGYFKMHIGSLDIDVSIEQPIELQIPTSYTDSENELRFVYMRDEKICYVKIRSIAPEKIAQHIDVLVAGKSPWKTPEDLYRKFYDNLAQFSDWDSTHLEVILATILRNKKDPMIAARLKEPYDPETHSIKSLPSIVSWSLGIAYENIGKSLSYGLINEDTKNLSQIEKVLFGEPLSDLSIEKLKEKKK